MTWADVPHQRCGHIRAAQARRPEPTGHPTGISEQRGLGTAVDCEGSLRCDNRRAGRCCVEVARSLGAASAVLPGALCEIRNSYTPAVGPSCQMIFTGVVHPP